MEYLDFVLEIGTASGREYPVQVVSSPAGEARETMQFPFDQLTLENRLQALQIALLRSGGKRRKALTAEAQAVRDFGQQLFDALISGEVRSRYDVSWQQALQQEKGLRLKLRIQAPELACLPWEFVYDSRGSEYVCLSRYTPVLRYLEMPHPPKPLIVAPPLRILGMTASPSDLETLDVERERGRIEEALKVLKAHNLVELTWLPGQTWRSLQLAMLQGPWHVFHFIGHGGFDKNTDEGLIALADDGGRTYRLTASALGLFLADHKSLRLAVLNSCEGARGSELDILSSTAAILVRRGLPAVVAMQYEISDKAAIEFARTFYQMVAEGMPVDAALAEARKAISVEVANSVEWGTPVLHMRAPDGVLFNIITGALPSSKPEPKIVPPSPLPQPKTSEPIPGKTKLHSAHARYNVDVVEGEDDVAQQQGKETERVLEVERHAAEKAEVERLAQEKAENANEDSDRAKRQQLTSKEAEEQAISHFQTGLKLHSKDHLEGAIAEYFEALRLKPDDPDAHFNLGNALFETGDVKRAITEYREALRLRPNDPDAHLNLGLALFKNSDLDGAIDEYREALRLKANDSEARPNLGNTLFETSDLKREIAEYGNAHNRLGLALFKKRDLEAAITEYREALRLKPNDPNVHYNLGNALFETDSLREAITEFREALRLEPDDPDAHFNLGVALFETGDVKRAIAEYREALRLKPNDPDAHLNLGNALFKKGDLDEAVDEYREALRLKPNDPNVHYNLGNALFEIGDVKRAITEYREALRLKPNNPEVHYKLGLALEKGGNLRGALAELRRARELNPNDPSFGVEEMRVSKKLGSSKTSR